MMNVKRRMKGTPKDFFVNQTEYTFPPPFPSHKETDPPEVPTIKCSPCA